MSRRQEKKGVQGSVQSGQRGFALLMVLLATAFLCAITVQLIRRVGWQIESTARQASSVVLDNAVLSGLSLAQAALLGDSRENEVDTLHDAWADSALAHSSYSFAPGVLLSIQIQDETGKAPLAWLAGSSDQEKAYFLRLFELIEADTDTNFRPEEQRAVYLRDALIDWQDSDNDPQEYGAEQSWYNQQSPVIKIANKPLRVPEDLLFVRGMTPALVYGWKMSNGEHHLGFTELVSVYGDTSRKININTAPAEVIQALHEDLSDTMVAELLDYRANQDNNEALSSITWLTSSGIVPSTIAINTSFLTTKSSFFQVTIRASLAHTPRQFRQGTAVLYRSEESQEILYWRVE